jgi:hypothetical protein
MTVYRLLEAFERAFRSQVYRHRVSTTGDAIAGYLYEDLFGLRQSSKLVQRILNGEVAVNTGNQIKGKQGRRGDGTFGRVVPGGKLVGGPGLSVPRGLVAHLEIGTEVKIGATKLIAQVDRVINDLSNQAKIFQSHNPNVISVAIVGVNYADSYTGWEKDRQFPAKTPPSREAAGFASRIERAVDSHYDELLILKFRATNTEPYDFHWVNKSETEQLYGSALVRLSAAYELRF